MGIDVSASKTTLLFGCQYPFRADVAIPEEAADEPGSPRERGNLVHDGIETGAPVPEALQGYVNASQEWLKSRGWPDTRKEVAFDWDGETSTELGIGRKAYAKKRPSALITGTVDVLFDFEDELVDWKTSEHGAIHARNQLRTLAVITGRKTIGAVELRADGTYGDHCRETLEDWDLDAHADQLRASIKAIPNSQPTPGEHCSEGFCPLRGICPAATGAAVAAVAELVPADSLVRRKITDPIASEADAAATVNIVSLLEDFVEAKKAEAKTWTLANGGSIRLDDKTVWKEVASKRKGVRGDEAVALAEKLGATPEELANLTYVTHFNSFKRVRSNAK